MSIQSLKHKVEYSFIATYFILCVIVCLCDACNPDSDCKDINYGDQYLIDTPGFPFPYASIDTLYFKDDAGHELKFRKRHLLPGGNTSSWQEHSQGVLDGPCVGESVIKSRQELMSAQFNADSTFYMISCQHFVKSIIDGTKPIFYDDLYAGVTLFENPVIYNISTSHRTNDRGNEAYFVDSTPSYIFDEHKILGTKEFNNVYSNTDPDGSEIYFNHEFGIVAFQDRGKGLWVLDKIE